MMAHDHHTGQAAGRGKASRLMASGQRGPGIEFGRRVYQRADTCPPYLVEAGHLAMPSEAERASSDRNTDAGGEIK